MRVLIVEDEEAVRKVFSDFVTALGHQPVAVETAELALEELRTGRPDAILLDLRLPGMSGLAFLDHPAARAARVPVVVVSGIATESEASTCLWLGALDYIQKPLALDRLSAVLEALALHADSPEPAEPGRRGERRPAPRVSVKFPVNLISDKGNVWPGTCRQLSATGMKVQTHVRLRPGGTVRVGFTPADGGPPLDEVALVIRVDDDGIALRFMDLRPSETRRLDALVERLLVSPRA